MPFTTSTPSMGEVREEGRRGLRPQGQAEKGGPGGERWRELPSFVAMLKYFHKRVRRREREREEEVGWVHGLSLLHQAALAIETNTGYATAAGLLPFPSPVLSSAFQFLRCCLSHSAGVSEEQQASGHTLSAIAGYLHQLTSQEEGQQGQSLAETSFVMSKSCGTV